MTTTDLGIMTFSGLFPCGRVEGDDIIIARSDADPAAEAVLLSEGMILLASGGKLMFDRPIAARCLRGKRSKIAVAYSAKLVAAATQDQIHIWKLVDGNWLVWAIPFQGACAIRCLDAGKCMIIVRKQDDPVEYVIHEDRGWWTGRTYWTVFPER